MSQAESLELAIRQEKENIQSLRMKYSSIETMLERKINKIQDKITGIEARIHNDAKISSKNTADDTFMRMKAKLIGKKVEREELQEKVKYLENQLLEEKKSIELAQKEMAELKEAEKRIDDDDNDMNSPSAEDREKIEQQLDSIEKELVKERSLLEELVKTKAELEKLVSDNMQLLVDFTTEI
ncbi:MAG: hypothetical protein ACTSP4_03890 [Candidatus Hodarchaeales archaeon]